MNQITFRKLVLGWSTVLVIAALTPTLRADEPVAGTSIYDGHRFIKDSIEEKVSAPREIERDPLFDNVPFLKLKAGDRLMKGRPWVQLFTGDEETPAPPESYFLLSGETFYELNSVREQDGKLLLRNGVLSLLFDWDVSLANAAKLQELEQVGLDPAITLPSFVKLKEALRKDFPESLRPTGDIKIAAPHLEGEGKARHAVFEGLGFERRSNTIFKYQLAIGDDIYIQRRQDLIVGPRNVERWEFEGMKGGGLDSPVPYVPDAETAARARADYDRMVAFQTTVNKFLMKPLPNNTDP